ncbi:uncharacterized protein K452DRAFT_339438 [Aplosporella prunicola CBS 121167]|uniref:MULE transposase domain-containing protein n=1 Tax=Aplosporella prunicola CBS 121167 TaxID=1176127 RepID=A0A6A6AST2_9PEZI|nr:uncharacterized protein K452DRAFT_339438 [Aplosporella prunicola CBS 121167]KAF2135082.1 hypothetical protein K452DRAFT_339438 [Aplosporella prunicola CBS 121167]
MMDCTSYSYGPWAIERLSRVIKKPSVFVTDCELALKNTLKTHYSDVPQQLCTWYITENVGSKIRQAWAHQPDPDVETTEDSEDIEQQRTACARRFQHLASAPTPAEWDTRWESIQNDYAEKEDFVSYIRTQWVPFKEQWCRA